MRRPLVLLVSLAVCLLPGTNVPAAASFPGANGRLAFYVFNAHPPAIWTMAADGSDQQRLRADRHAQYEPDWSADGTRILFARYGGARDALVSVAADGTDLQVIATDRTLPRAFGQPVWAPSGTQIAFCAFGHDDLLKVFVINTDGTGLQNVSGAGQDECYPSWSPDGTQLAFVTGAISSASSDIATMDADGSNRVTVVTTGDNSWPDWSPDGQRIAYVRRVNGGSELWAVDADGANDTQITDSPGVEYTPAWAPDGTAIAYCRSRRSNVDSPCDVFTIAPDGTGVVRLTDTPRRDEFNVTWQPLTG